MLSMILFQHYLHILPGAESSLGHMEKCWWVILLQTTCSTSWLGLEEPFPRHLAALSLHCHRLTTFKSRFSSHSVLLLSCGLPPAQAQPSCWPATQKSSSGSSAGGSNTNTWHSTVLEGRQWAEGCQNKGKSSELCRRGQASLEK